MNTVAYPLPKLQLCNVIVRHIALQNLNSIYYSVEEFPSRFDLVQRLKLERKKEQRSQLLMCSATAFPL